ncbi:MAG: mechanosensitive ion channel [Clostridia bacterium]|nr:mechanosensitive ion channel [Clostridia bacterium]
MEKFLDFLVDFAVEYGLKIVGALLVLVIGLSLCNLIIKLVRKGKAFNKLSLDTARFAASAMGIVLKLIVILTCIAILGVPMSSIIALLGTAGVAIGLGLQGSLSNFAGGIILMIFRPFHVGDYIDTGTYAGTVETIGVYYTYLTTIDNSRVVVPNSVVSNLTLKDFSSYEKRRVDLVFKVDYSNDIEKVKSVILETAANNELVLKEPAPFVRLSNHGDSSLDFTCRTWCASSDYWTVYFDLTENVKKAFDANGITVPFPQMDVHIKNS